MERKMFDDPCFESALRERVEGYRMYPADNRWTSVYEQLHPKPRLLHPVLYSLFTLLLIGTSLSTSLFQHQPAQLPLQLLSGRAKSTQAISPQSLPTVPTAQTTSRTPAIAFMVTSVVDADGNNAPLAANTVPEVETDAIATTASLTKVAQEPLHTGAVMPGFTFVLPEQTETTLNRATDAAHTETDAETAPATDAEAPQPLTDKELNYEVSLPTATRIKRPTQVLFYGTPSVSYRVLIADNKITLGNLNPETQVAHAASIGWETGVAGLLPLSDRLNVRVGGQINYTRYTVAASQGGPEISNVLLTTSARMQRVSTLRNTNSGLPRQLANETLQLSIPLGIEYRLAGTSRLSWNLAGTLQPTYLLAATGYLVSTDYRNYFKAPDLLRRLNLNTALETFVRFQAGAFDLQAGPQLRYQVLSNSTGIYPIREHLIDYGFKLGIIRTIR